MLSFIWTHNKTNRYIVSFEDVKASISNKDYLLINTLPIDQQEYLIQNTVASCDEEKVINSIFKHFKPDIHFSWEEVLKIVKKNKFRCYC